MAQSSTPLSHAAARNVPALIGAASTVWLIAAPVAGHFLWADVPWIVVVLLAAMAELIVLAAWLVASTLHEPVRRWDLPPNPADAHRGWRGLLARMHHRAQDIGGLIRQKWLRRAAKV